MLSSTEQRKYVPEGYSYKILETGIATTWIEMSNLNILLFLGHNCALKCMDRNEPCWLRNWLAYRF